jgi:hypothetical protein
MFGLLVDPRFHHLDVAFCGPFPHVNKKLNVLFAVMQHLANIANREMTPLLPKTVTTRIPEKFVPNLNHPSQTDCKPGTALPLLPHVAAIPRIDQPVRDRSDLLLMLRMTTPWQFSAEQYQSGSTSPTEPLALWCCL